MRRRDSRATTAGPGPDRRGRRGCRGDAGSTSLEVVLVVPVLMLLALFVLWSGRGARAALIADLAAEEAATAAALACDRDDDSACEDLVAEVLSARPGLDFLCIGGARPDRSADPDGFEGLVEDRFIRFDSSSEATGVGLFGVRFLCETDGAVAPLQGVFPTVTFRGQATEVAIHQGPPRARIVDAVADEGGDLEFVVRLDGPAPIDFELNYTVDDSTTVVDLTDYTTGGDCNDPSRPDYEQPLQPEVMLSQGDLEGTISIETCDDNLFEADEQIRVTLGKPPPIDPNDPDGPRVVEIPADGAAALGTITDNDPPPRLSVSTPTAREAAGARLQFRVTVGSTLGRDLTFNYSTAQGSGDNPANPGAEGSPCPDPNEGDPVDYIAIDTERSHVFVPGGGNRTVEIGLCDDVVGEPDETLELDWSTSLQEFGSGSAVGTITDNEPRIRVKDECQKPQQDQVVEAHVCMSEDGGMLEFTVERVQSGDPPLGVTARYVTVPIEQRANGDFEAHAGGVAPIDNPCASPPEALEVRPPDQYHDYVPLTGTVTIPEDQTTGTVTVAVERDLLDEHNELFRLLLCHPSDNAYIDDPWGRGLIIDDDDPPNIEVADTSATEPATGGDTAELEFTVTLDAPSGREVALDYYTDHVEHYVPPDTAPGDVEALTATPGEDYTPIQPQQRVTFDPTITRNSPIPEHTISVPVLHDTLDEGDDVETGAETLALRLADPVHAGFADGTGSCGPGAPGNDCALGLIIDNDPPPELTVAGECTLTVPGGVAACAVEGQDVKFTLTLDPASGQDVEVEWRVAAGGATRGDFVVSPPLPPRMPEGTATIEEGATAATFVVETFDDDLDEHDFETFELELTSVDGADIAPGHETTAGAIADNDAPPVVAVLDRCVTGDGWANSVADHGDACAIESSKSMQFTVELRHPVSGNSTGSGRDITLLYETRRMSPPPAGLDAADAGTDYVIVDTDTPDRDRRITIPAGTRSLPFPVSFHDDYDDESDEIFLVDVAHDPGNPGVVQIPDPTGQGVIVDDDDVLLYFTDNCEAADGDTGDGDTGAWRACAGESDGTMAFTVELNEPVDRTVTVWYYTTDIGSLGDESATGGSDYYGWPSMPEKDRGVLEIPANRTTAAIGVTIEDDDIYEHDERFLLHLARATATLDGPQIAVGAILDDEDKPRVTVDDSEAEEGEPVEFPVRLLDAIGRQVSVNYHTYSTGPGNYLDAVGGTATSPGADYRQILDQDSAVVVFAAGESEKKVPVDTFEDAVVEGDERFELRLTNPWNAVLAADDDNDDRGIGTIVDGCIEPADHQPGDPLPEIELEDATVAEGVEGGVLVLAVEVKGRVCTDIELEYKLVDGTAIGSTDDTGDFRAVSSGSLTLEAGSSSVELGVEIFDDDLLEDDEVFYIEVTWAGGQWSGLADSDREWITAEVTILDNDGEPVVVVHGPSDWSLRTTNQGGQQVFSYAAVEGLSLEFEVYLADSNDPEGPPVISDEDLEVSFATLSSWGTSLSASVAQPGVDYSRVPSTLLKFPANELTVHRFAIEIFNDDDDDEPRENFGVYVHHNDDGSDTGAAMSQGFHAAIVEIMTCADRDDDVRVYRPGVYRVENATGEIGEGAGDGFWYGLLLRPEFCGGEGFEIDYTTSDGPECRDDTTGDAPECFVEREGILRLGPFAVIPDHVAATAGRDYVAASGTLRGRTDDYGNPFLRPVADGNPLGLPLSIVDDHVDEEFHRAFSVDFHWGDSMPEPYLEEATRGHPVTILDDEDLVVAVHSARAREGRPLVFEVTATPSLRRFEVPFHTGELPPAGGTATQGAEGTSCGDGSGSDYIARSGTLTFEPVTNPLDYGPGSVVTQTIEIETCPDNDPEDSESFELYIRLENGPEPVGPDDVIGVTIPVASGRIDDCIDPQLAPSTRHPPTLTVQDVTVLEGASATMEVTVGPITFCDGAVLDFRTVDGTASHPSDYLGPDPGEYHFPAHQPTVNHPTYTAVDDDVAEGPETFQFEVAFCGLSTVTCEDAGWHEGYAGLPAAVATVTIVDCVDALAPGYTGDPVTITGSGGPYIEGDGTVTTTWTLGEEGVELCDDAEFQWRTRGSGTATENDDFVLPSPSRLAVPAGTSEFTIPVTLLDDSALEGVEDIRLAVRWRDGVPLSWQDWSPARFHILDDDCISITSPVDERVPEMSVPEPATVTEGGRLTSVLTVDPPLCSPAQTHTTLRHVTTEPEDFAGYRPGTPGSGFFDAGEPLATAAGTSTEIALLEDSLDEWEETFELARNWDPVWCGTAAPRLCNQPAATATYTVRDVCVADEDLNDGTVQAMLLTMAGTGIEVDEGASSYDLEASIERPFCSSDAHFIWHAEPGADPAAGAGDVHNLDGAGATARFDFGARTARVTVQGSDTGAVIDDSFDEDDEQFTLLVSWNGASMPEHYADLEPVEVTVTIVDDDPEPQLVVYDVEQLAGDDGSGSTMVFTVGLENALGEQTASGREVTVNYRTNPVTATEGESCNEQGADYVAASGGLVFSPEAPGDPADMTRQVSVTVCGDSDGDEPHETLQLTLVDPDMPAPVNATIGDGIGVGTIAGLPRVTIEPLRLDIGEGDGTGAFEVVADALTGDLTVGWETLACATSGQWCPHPAAAGDYVAASGTVTLRPGNLRASFDVEVTDDSVDGHDVQFYVRLKTPSIDVLFQDDWGQATVAGIGHIGQATIIDDEPLPTVGFVSSRYAVPEGHEFTFEVELDAASGRDVTVHWQTRDVAGAGAATAGEDYTAASSTLTIKAGDTKASFTVETKSDSDGIEPDEVFEVVLSSPDYAVLGGQNVAEAVIEPPGG